MASDRDVTRGQLSRGEWRAVLQATRGQTSLPRRLRLLLESGLCC